MEYVRLGDYVKIDSGFAFKSTLFNEEAGIRLLRIRDVTGTEKRTYYTGEYDEKYLVNNEDLLISMDGSFVVNKWSEGVGLLNQRVCRISSSNPELSENYLKWLLPKRLKEIEDKTSFVTVKHLSVKKIEEIEFQLPPLETQQKIADTLDKAQQLINNRKQQITELDNLTQSIFYDMFGDPVSNSKKYETIQFDEVIVDLRYGTSNPPKFSDTGYKFIRATNIKKGKILNGNMYYISQEEADKLPKCKLELNEIIFVRSGVNSGDNAIVTESFAGEYGAYDIMVKINLEKVNPIFLNILFNTDYLDRIIKPLTRRAAQPHLNAEQIRNLDVILPTVKIQNVFAETIQMIEKQKTILEKSLVELENNFKSLMQKSFK